MRHRSRGSGQPNFSVQQSYELTLPGSCFESFVQVPGLLQRPVTRQSPSVCPLPAEVFPGRSALPDPSRYELPTNAKQPLPPCL